MTRAAFLSAVLALAGCLPTPDQVCDGLLRGVIAQAAGSTPADMAVACAVVP